VDFGLLGSHSIFTSGISRHSGDLVVPLSHWSVAGTESEKVRSHKRRDRIAKQAEDGFCD